MKARDRIRLTLIASVTIICALFGIMLAPGTETGVIGGAVAGALVGWLVVQFEFRTQRPWLRKRLQTVPPPLVFAARMLIYGVIFVAIPNLVAWVMGEIAPNPGISAALTTGNLVITYIAAIGINFVMVQRRMLGIRNLMAMATGRYRIAQEEERIVAFMDLKGSTAIAERLGGARYHQFLNEVFFDMTEPIIGSGGAVYQYVGDEVVVTWKAPHGLEDAACMRYFFAVEETLARRRDHYLAAYGSVPGLRGALHIGPLMVGEIGDLNRQIVMIGDTMNTASRIEGACRKFGRDYVASAAVIQRLGVLPADLVAESLGPVALAGKVSEMELFALGKRTEE